MRTNSPIPRASWLRLWSALPAERIHALADSLASRYEVDDLTLPQSGLGLLPLREGALGESYYIGEIPLARACVRLRTPAGETVEGGAQIIDDRASLARSLAILDAVLAGRLPGAEDAQTLLEEGEQRIQRVVRERKRLLAATRVDFSLLGAEEDEHA